jgi:hypothetical protein
MIELEIWVFAGCFGLLGVLWGYSMRNISLQIAEATQEAPDWSSLIAEVKELIPEVPSAGQFDIGEMVQDAIEDAMGNVQMPTALDHIAGFATMFLQQKMMQTAPPAVAAGLNALNEHGTESFAHGPQVPPKI